MKVALGSGFLSAPAGNTMGIPRLGPGLCKFPTRGFQHHVAGITCPFATTHHALFQFLTKNCVSIHIGDKKIPLHFKMGHGHI